MTQRTSAPVEGLIFDNNESVNAVDNNSTVTNLITTEAAQQPVFAVTKGNIGTATPWTSGQIAEVLAAPKLHAIVKEVRAIADEQQQKAEKEKRKYDIIGICPHFFQFRDNHRAAANALAECCTYMTCVDVDDRQYGQQAIDGALRLNAKPGQWHDKLLYIENSLRGGGKCHIWLICPLGMNAIETQQAFCKDLDIPCDDAVQQKQSFILMTGDAVYRSPRWLQPLTQDEVEARREIFRRRGLTIDGWDKANGTVPASTKTAADETPIAMPADSDIIAPTPRTDYIYESFYRQTGLEPTAIATEGKCHNSLKSLLSTGIVQLLTKPEMQGQLRHRTPDYWKCQDCQRLVSDFYAKYNDPSRALTREQRQILAASEKMNEAGTAVSDFKPQVQPTCDELTLSEIYASPEPPRMNRKKMPRVVKTVTSRTPDENMECVSQACFPPLEAHPVGLSARYIDNRPRELRSNCLTIAETGIGKNCIALPVKHIMADIQAITASERKAEQDYHQNYNTRNSNVDKPKRRKFRIRNLMANLTSAALIRRTDDNDGAPLFCLMNELEQWDKVENASGSKNQFTNLKLNDDEFNTFGAERAGTQSVTAATSLHLNWIASTTPGKAVRYFRNVMTDGPISRLTLATIPDPGIGAPAPVFGDYDDRYDAALKPFIDNLNAATGQIDCRQARQMIKELKAECDEFAIASGDRVFDNLTHRALVHVFRKAICIYVANGMKWEATIKPFCRWSLHYDLWLKLHFFGEYIRNADDQIKTSKRGPANLLEQIAPNIGDSFDTNTLVCARLKNGMKEEGTSNMLSQWKKRHLIEQLADGKFRRTDFQKNDR